MRKCTLFLALGFLLLQTSALAQRNCYSHEYLQQQIEEDPGRLIRLEQIEEQSKRLIQSGQLMNARNGGNISVVVHVVYNPSNPEGNISESKIISQIDVLNADFLRENTDADGTWPQAAGTEISFCLAGITRTETTASSFGTNDAVKTLVPPWDPGKYLNVWVCEISGGILGYAQFPGGPPSTDGVVCHYLAFGTEPPVFTNYNLGRTMTHEVGHFLNLRHIWGDGGCGVDDGVGDTPIAGAPNYGCPSGANSCKPKGKNRNDPDDVDMIQNYMDYTYDNCMNLFTAGQATRMQTLLNVDASRASLLAFDGCDGNPPSGDQEICDNQKDDDGDGLIDCADPDCGVDDGCDPPDPGGDCIAANGLTSTPSGNLKKRYVEAILEWSYGTSTGNYTLRIKASGDSQWQEFSVSGSPVGISNLLKGASYDWQIVTNCPGNETAESGIATFVAGESSSTRRAAVAPSLRVYPNPAGSVVNVDLGAISLESDQVLLLTDIMGRKLQEQRIDSGSQTLRLNVSDLPNGLYLIRISDRDGNINSTKKLLIQH